MDEGYIKYQLHWDVSEALPHQYVLPLMQWRQRMYERQWIGYDAEQKVGFGNISMRLDPSLGHFLISGTQTGELSKLVADHFTIVSDYDISANQLWCRGPVKASSESLTHAACYELSENIHAVIHIHNRPLWNWMCRKYPATDQKAAYGTPAMAYEVKRLYQETDLPNRAVFAMAGHQDGIIAFGPDLAEAAGRLFQSHEAFLRDQK